MFTAPPPPSGRATRPEVRTTSAAEVVTLDLGTPGRVTPGSGAPGTAADPVTGLPERVRAAVADATTRVLVLDGLESIDTPNHDRVDTESLRAHLGALVALTQILPTLPVPVLGVARGMVADNGCLIAAHCDLVLASDRAGFGLLSATRGLPPAVQRLAVASAVGDRFARAMATSARPIGTDRALHAGLVTDAVPAAVLDAELTALILHLTGLDQTAVELDRSVRLHPRVDADRYELAVEATMCAHSLVYDADVPWFGLPDTPGNS